MSKSPFITLARQAEYAEDVKKSRFIARAAPVNSAQEAMEFLERVREDQATHNCWAYRIGNEYRFNDDGEPGGTAGRPILGAIERQGVDRVMVVVTRYYGGIKLGAGGLARAYGGVASSCLRLAAKREVIPMIAVRLTMDFEHAGKVHQLTDKFQAKQIRQQYTETGVVVEMEIPLSRLDDFKIAAMNVSRGQAELTELAPDLSSNQERN